MRTDPVSPTVHHCSPTEPYWAPKTPIEHHRPPTDPQLSSNDLYWTPLTPTESHWAQCSLHLAPLSYMYPSVTHNDYLLSQMNPIWPQITLNNFRLSSNCLKRPQPNQLCQLSSTFATFPSKKATNEYLFIHNIPLTKNWRCGKMDYKPTSQGVEFNISLNRHVRCILCIVRCKSNRMSIPFWNQQTFCFKDCRVLEIPSQFFKILSLFALHQGGFWLTLRT